ncbi:MAG: hypothetical protein ABIE47_09315, partial [Pseudomonadota bacterium]
MKFESDPSTIFRSYGAGAEIGQKGAFFKGLGTLDVMNAIMDNPFPKSVTSVEKCKRLLEIISP